MMRPKARIAIFAMATLAVVSLPGRAEAQRGGGGVLDWINKLSGPTTYGFLFHVEMCLDEVVFDAGACHDNLDFLDSTGASGPREVATYVRLSTGYAPFTRGEERVGDPADINRVFLEPWLLFIIKKGAERTHWTLHPLVGMGLGFHRVSGDGFTEFWRHSYNGKAGVRFQKRGARLIDKFYIEAGVNVRFFPDRFRSEDFGGPPEIVPDGGEWAFGADVLWGLRF